MKKNDFTNLKRYHNQWVAVDQNDENKVVGVGKTLSQALNKAEKKGVKNPVLTKVPENYGAFIL